MGKSKTNISQINSYVKGKLDTRAMHSIERETYEDAFLNEALEGYEEMPGDDHEQTIDELKGLLARRAAPPRKGKIVAWRFLPIAASVLILMGAGYWFITSPKETKPRVPGKKVSERIVANKPETKHPENMVIPAPDRIAIVPKAKRYARQNRKATEISPVPSVVYKTDTVEYIANNHNVKKNASVDEVLKKVPGFEVDSSGNIAFQGQLVTKARLNGKDYAGGDVAQATKNLPADILEKIQVVDDYGDQASLTGIKTGEPDKILNLTTRNANNTASAKLAFMNDIAIKRDYQVIYKPDTVEYIVNRMPFMENAKAGNIIMRLDGFELGNDYLMYVGKPVKKILINNIDQADRTVIEGIKRTPVNLLSKVQVIDDYSHATPGFKASEPEKILNLVLLSSKNRRQPTQRKIADLLVPGDLIARPLPQIGWSRYAEYVRANSVSPDGKTGEVFLSFNVEPNGEITGIRIISGFGIPKGFSTYTRGSEIMNQKAINIIKNGPKWKGDSVTKQMQLNIIFTR